MNNQTPSSNKQKEAERNLHLRAVIETYNDNALLELPKTAKPLRIGILELTQENEEEIRIFNPKTRQSYTVSLAAMQMNIRDGLVTRNVNDFFPSPTVPSSIYRIAGVSHLQEEGLNMLSRLANKNPLPENIVLKAIHEPENKYDPNAIKLVAETTAENGSSPKIIRIGYIKKEQNEDFIGVADISKLRIRIESPGELKANPNFAENPDDQKATTYFAVFSLEPEETAQELTKENAASLRVQDRIHISDYMFPGTVTAIGETLIPGKTYPLIRIIFDNGKATTQPIRTIEGATFFHPEN